MCVSISLLCECQVDASEGESLWWYLMIPANKSGPGQINLYHLLFTHDVVFGTGLLLLAKLAYAAITDTVKPFYKVLSCRALNAVRQGDRASLSYFLFS